MHAIEGSGKLTVQTRVQTLNTSEARILQLKQNNYVRLCITDTGCGMDKITQDKIFEPFYTTKGDKGTGLGLAQVYGFIKRSGGAIQVYSEPGHGTEFVLYFPCHQDTVEKKNIIAEKQVKDTRGNETILVVDDEDALVNLTCEILQQQGYKTLPANSAKQALEILETQTIDLLLSDIIMPEIDGYQLAAMVQEKYPAIKIQLASGFSDDRHLNMLNSNLHAELIHKPYRAQTLLKRIRSLLDEN